VFDYDPGEFWDEMFVSPDEVRPYYASLAKALATLSQDEVERRQRAADLSFQARGITFAINQGPEGVEKIMPFDLVPRIITAEEWHKIERGLDQRVRALNLFLHDIYHDGAILRQKVVPPELVLGSRGYCREVRGMDVPLGVYTHVVGSDLVRDETGEFYVLEDNLRTPSGVSYVVENRRVLKRVWSQIFHGYDVRPVEGYAQDLLDVLRAVAPQDVEDEPTVVLLTPGVYNSAYFEHAFLAKGMGVQMVEEPILPTIRTYLPSEPDELQYILEHIGELVVKSVNESGGYGMLIGPHSTRAQHDEFRAYVKANPRGYIAQPTLALSRHPCWVDDHFEGRHVDLRPFVLYGREIKVTAGGLTRVAMRRGSLVVNSSQGGGGKDTWVLAEASG
jgi:uncharacterized circularly permuted ATP-grasp superfamily protein